MLELTDSVPAKDYFAWKSAGWTDEQITAELDKRKGKVSKSETPTPQASLEVLGINLTGPYKDHKDLRNQMAKALESRGYLVLGTAQGSKGKGAIYQDPLPDDYIAKDGEHWWIEAKMPKQGPTDSQLKVQTQLRNQGIKVLTYYTVLEVFQFLGIEV